MRCSAPPTIALLGTLACAGFFVSAAKTCWTNTGDTIFNVLCTRSVRVKGDDGKYTMVDVERATAKDTNILQAAIDNDDKKQTIAQAEASGGCKVKDSSLGTLIADGKVDADKVFYWNQLLAGPANPQTDSELAVKMNVYIADYKTDAGEQVRAMSFCSIWSATRANLKNWDCVCWGVGS